MLTAVLSHIRRQYAGFLALFVVLGGTSYAVAAGSIDSRAIKNNTVRSTDIRNGTREPSEDWLSLSTTGAELSKVPIRRHHTRAGSSCVSS